MVLPAKCNPSACVYAGLLDAFLPRLFSNSNQRVLTRVKALSLKSKPFMWGSVSKTRPGMPVSVSELPLSSSELPVIVDTVATPAKRSAGNDVSLL